MVNNYNLDGKFQKPLIPLFFQTGFSAKKTPTTTSEWALIINWKQNNINPPRLEFKIPKYHNWLGFWKCVLFFFFQPIWLHISLKNKYPTAVSEIIQHPQQSPRFSVVMVLTPIIQCEQIRTTMLSFFIPSLLWICKTISETASVEGAANLPYEAFCCLFSTNIQRTSALNTVTLRNSVQSDGDKIIKNTNPLIYSQPPPPCSTGSFDTNTLMRPSSWRDQQHRREECSSK